MFKAFIFGIIVLTVLKQVKSDEGVSQILSTENIYEIAPKVWHLYIKTFLYKVINKSHLFTVKESVCLLDNNIRLFSQNSEKRWLKPVEPNYTLIITRASGRLELVDVGIFVYFARKFLSFPPDLPHVAYTWILQMDVSLRAHLNFGSIYFPLSPYDCMKGNITISQNSILFPTFMFCGQMATLFLYPSSSKIKIKISVMEDILYKVNMSYMVIDNNLIETTKGNFNSSELLYSLVSIRKHIKIISYFIQVKKTQKIFLNITNSRHTLLFDGPGHSSEVIQKITYLIKTNKENYITTTFQCLLQILTFHKMINHETAHFHFSGTDQPLLPIYISNKSINIEIPSNICRSVPCFLHVRVPSGQHVNITIFNQSYIGQRTMNCKYGGVSFVEKTRLSYN